MAITRAAAAKAPGFSRPWRDTALAEGETLFASAQVTAEPSSPHAPWTSRSLLLHQSQ